MILVVSLYGGSIHILVYKESKVNIVQLIRGLPLVTGIGHKINQSKIDNIHRMFGDKIVKSYCVLPVLNHLNQIVFHLFEWRTTL